MKEKAIDKWPFALNKQLPLYPNDLAFSDVIAALCNLFYGGIEERHPPYSLEESWAEWSTYYVVSSEKDSTKYTGIAIIPVLTTSFINSTEM